MSNIWVLHDQLISSDFLSIMIINQTEVEVELQMKTKNEEQDVGVF
jgi:hypothetical protein